MKKTALAVISLCAATSYGIIVHDSPTGGTMWGWNWTGGPTTHDATEVDIGGGDFVVHHESVIDNSGGTNAVDVRMGSKWDITLSGNTSADPADYTISFDVRNLSGSFDPIPLGLAVLTKEAGGDQGHGYAPANVSVGSSWTHVEYNLADWANNWWQGTAWDMTNSSWSLELGMPWPGQSVAAGETFTQVWETNNLQIEMIPEPATMGLVGIFGAGVLFVRRRFMI